MSNSSTSISGPKFIPPKWNWNFVESSVSFKIHIRRHHDDQNNKSRATISYLLLKMISLKIMLCFIVSRVTASLHSNCIIYTIKRQSHRKIAHKIRPLSLSNNQSSEFSSLYQFFPSMNYYYFHPLSSILKTSPSQPTPLILETGAYIPYPKVPLSTR